MSATRGRALHPILAEAVKSLGLVDDLPHLTEAYERSEETLQRAHDWLHEKVPIEEAKRLDVVVHGSYARREASGESDFDYLVIAHGLSNDVQVTRRLLQATDDFIVTKLDTRTESRDGARRPGRTGLFGNIASAPDLTERIGLEQDTNVSHTRRLLVLVESSSIYQPELRNHLVEAILERYLIDYPDRSKEGVPRFLLNDIIRYWYTLAVDYQAKRWQHANPGWGLRYLKLLLSRKLSYAGTLVSLLRCDEDNPASPDSLRGQFDIPPLARLSQLALDARFNNHDALRMALLSAEEFATFLAEPSLRRRAAEVSSIGELSNDHGLARMRELAENLHDALGKVLFDSFLSNRARRYLAL